MPYYLSMDYGICPYCNSHACGDYCDTCGQALFDEHGCSTTYYPPSKSSVDSEKKTAIEEDLEKILEKLYDLEKSKNPDTAERKRLLTLYKTITGEEKPGFMA